MNTLYQDHFGKNKKHGQGRWLKVKINILFYGDNSSTASTT
jgi:hypothetical protein